MNAIKGYFKRGIVNQLTNWKNNIMLKQIVEITKFGAYLRKESTF